MTLGFHALSSPVSQNVHMFTNPELSEPHRLGFTWRLHCMVMIDQTFGHWPYIHPPASLPSLKVAGGGERGRTKGKGGDKRLDNSSP